MQFNVERYAEQHFIVFILLCIFLLAVWASTFFSVNDNCHALNPTIDCSTKTTIHRADVMNSCWVNVSLLSTHGMDEYREIPSCDNGLRHAKFLPNSDVGTVHFDRISATTFPFGTVDHLADEITFHTHINNWIAIIIMWGIIFFGVYYALRITHHLHKHYRK